MNTYIGLIILIIAGINCQSLETSTKPIETTTSNTALPETTTLPQATTTLPQTTTVIKQSSTVSPSDSCAFIGKNATCQNCLSDKCFFCNEDSSCKPLVFDGIFPAGCKASQARWLNCSLNFEALLIAVVAIGIVILLIIFSCICYCCNATCKSISDSNFKRFERKIQKQRDYLKQKNSEQRQDRQTKNEAIRIKYGLKPSTYTQMDN